MSTLKDKFENYEKQPDEKVWQSIMETMNNRVSTVRRRRIVLSASAVAVASVALLFAVSRKDDSVAFAKSNGAASEKVQNVAVNNSETVAADGEMIAAIPNKTETKAVATANFAEERKENVIPAAFESDLAPKAISETKTEEKKATEQIRTEQQSAAVQQKDAVATEQPVIDDKEKKSMPQSKIEQPKVPAQDLVVWIPNAFSPDDPMNDDVRQFKVYPNSEANLLSYEIFIYSRSGRQVFHSKDVSQGWDGTYNGHKQPMGTYVYIIELNDANKGLQHKKGTVTLIR